MTISVFFDFIKTHLYEYISWCLECELTPSFKMESSCSLLCKNNFTQTLYKEVMYFMLVNGVNLNLHWVEELVLLKI